MLSSILQKIPIVIAAIFMIIALWRMLKCFRNVPRSEFMLYFKNAKYIVVVFLIATMVLSCFFAVFNHIHSKKYVYAIISLNYSEASQALNSNGTRFNMAEITSDEVLERAIEKGAFPDVTAKDLKACLAVYPYVQGDVKDETSYHISTEFVVEYYASKDTDHLNSENVINIITAAYKEYYIERYTDNFALDAPDKKPDYSKMEYMDIVSYFTKETNSILNYLYGMAEKSPSFTTAEGATFNSIAGKVFQFQETQIFQNLKSHILQNGIARDKGNYVDRLSYRNKNTDFDRQKNAISFKLCNDAIDMYSEEMTRVVLVPTWDEHGKYYMGRTKVGIDELSVKATEFSDYVSTNEKEIMDNNLIIDKINGSAVDPVVINETDALVVSIDKSIENFAIEAIAAGREYSNHRMNQCVAVTISGVSLFSELKSIVLFAAFAYAAFILYSISKNMAVSEEE